MNNSIEWNLLYNHGLKKRFAQNYPKPTQRTIYHIFLKTKELEEILKKDLYEFNKIELESILREFKAKTVKSLRSKQSIISQYIDFCIENNLLLTGINLIKSILQDDLENYIDTTALENKYITEEELYEITDKFCENAQDALCFLLLWEGIRGEKLYELRNLKIDDVNFNNNKINITDKDGSKRVITVSNKTIETIKEAISQNEYIKTNYDDVKLVSDTRKIKVTPYVLRGSTNTRGDTLSYMTVWQRIKKISEIYGNPYLTANNIYWSGMINMAKKIKEKNGNLTDEDYKNIAERYNYKFNNRVNLYEFINNIKNNL